MATMETNTTNTERRRSEELRMEELRNELGRTLTADSSSSTSGLKAHEFQPVEFRKPLPSIIKHGSLAAALNGSLPEGTGASIAMNDTPATTAPSSPRMRGDYFPDQQGADGAKSISLMAPMRQNSGTSTPRARPTTLDIPGLTKSKVSPDGRIAQRDVGAKLVIIMVGLPARGKSYITKKLVRYLNWLQHDAKIFNVGERRRVAAGGPHDLKKTKSEQTCDDGPSGEQSARTPSDILSKQPENAPSVARIVLNGLINLEPPATPPQTTTTTQPPPNQINGHTGHEREDSRDIDMPSKSPEPQAVEMPTEPEEVMEQNSAFFDPENKKASQIREQVARETLDELLDYVLDGNGSVGILDATNSTMERRKMVMDRIRERAGPDLNVLFLESRCVDPDLLEANMRLKLGGPDYKDMDPVVALKDFKERVKVYEKAYVPLGEYEEKNNMPYIQMIDVGRKIISHQIKGFLSAQANYYLLNFNLAPRQIWITRHGLSQDNISGKIGGDSDLAPEGEQYAKTLARFMDEKRKEWDLKQFEALKRTHFPPQKGDATPPNPHYNSQSPTTERHPFSELPNGSLAAADSVSTDSEATVPEYEPKSFCVWTSMLKRSIQTAQYFNDEEYDTKQMRMLDELNAGVMEGLTYSCISTQYPAEYRSRKQDKLHYRYPGPGGEGYLDIINRLRPVIVELERMTDHVLLVGHRSVARVLLAYFRGLKREEVADLDVPLGMLYCLEPKPYGVDFKAYKWDKSTEWFHEVPKFQLKRAEDDMQ
ncbi:hypothetical protein LTR08_001015 [Meristemomyces frigidus]|nr:hypothetical protein LTR08_001015 [Meristemomyces frigidus]